MKVETLRKIAREYRLVAERKLDDKELCKGFSDLCREEGIAWTQLRALVDAEAADARDGGHRVGKIVEKANFASAYAEILAGSKDEQISQIRSSASINQNAADPDTGIVRPAPGREIKRESESGKREHHDPESYQSSVSASGTEKLRQQLQASIAMTDALDLPAFLDRRPS
jgi:hypothetical protein